MKKEKEELKNLYEKKLNECVELFDILEKQKQNNSTEEQNKIKQKINLKTKICIEIQVLINLFSLEEKGIFEDEE